ncbi:unnamed protein product [Miscanthus lutarioriparius]|uniref:Aldehyde dehydrogenase domain-containing protein n=1 Tax=Miscanthus lutarioriparius TaxID=422564 RepID=A0A811NZ98_9POAL|nr:unnamed protein product [Miscanthus lutarioriparius]
MERIRSAGLLRTQGLIAGKWVDTYDGKTIKVQNPATGEVLANVPCMGSRETSDAIASAHSTFYYYSLAAVLPPPTTELPIFWSVHETMTGGFLKLTNYVSVNYCSLPLRTTVCWV